MNDPRVTRLGKYLRKFRLDELPQFINVIRGQMSFAGPRPEWPSNKLRQEIPYYDERHSVRPGLTGSGQVHTDLAAGVEDAYRKLEYDLFYLKDMSVLLISPSTGYALDSGSRRPWCHVGRAPSPAAGPLAGLQQADGGVRRGPGGPPHQAHA